ncbi:uncharacterized protein K452DRAFT_59487 [Aplosporella prunicola CBS 121167]|uniref:Uncharacterized protein n=1 Tax=Aplosporella prunicola CBS 121167 TaxID=1176127 RepID=A0A6A6BAS9_9PEZI|nr:uncharacterized protein K452DRAFT_59487 [Aplosporella prunicola CBS 121167]KAF2140017.1 hypothetical protein K452DRAFT_59487 [Aplosporella prunicola CBS 121167]
MEGGRTEGRKEPRWRAAPAKPSRFLHSLEKRKKASWFMDDCFAPSPLTHPLSPAHSRTPLVAVPACQLPTYRIVRIASQPAPPQTHHSRHALLPLNTATGRAGHLPEQASPLSAADASTALLRAFLACARKSVWVGG